jgi:mannose-6-phosphate isomerase-like protein (cupin superfamily)
VGDPPEVRPLLLEPLGQEVAVSHLATSDVRGNEDVTSDLLPIPGEVVDGTPVRQTRRVPSGGGYGPEVKRHSALIALSHDHHHALVEARRLRRAADADADPGAAVDAFVDFFVAVSVPHFREEEETLLPLVAEVEEARPLVVEALLDHQRLRALVSRLQRSDDVRGSMRELGSLLEAHVRREERELFPLVERLAADRLDRHGPTLPDGPVWGQASEDLNATLLAWRAGEGPAEHVNAERDVLVFLVDGSATITVDGEARELRPGEALIVGKGRGRTITAGRNGVRYLSVHLRRPPLQIEGRVERRGS